MVKSNCSSVPKITLSRPTSVTPPHSPGPNSHLYKPEQPDLLWSTRRPIKSGVRKHYKNLFKKKKRRGSRGGLFEYLAVEKLSPDSLILKPSDYGVQDACQQEKLSPGVLSDSWDPVLEETVQQDSSLRLEAVSTHDPQEKQTAASQEFLHPTLGHTNLVLPKPLTQGKKRSFDSIVEEPDAETASHSKTDTHEDVAQNNYSNGREKPEELPVYKKPRTDASNDIASTADILTTVSLICRANPKPGKLIIVELLEHLQRLPKALTAEGRFNDRAGAETFMWSLIDHKDSSRWGSLYAFDDLRKRLGLMLKFGDAASATPTVNANGVHVL